MVTTVGTPQTVAAQELRIETMFPADDETEREHVALLERSPGALTSLARPWLAGPHAHLTSCTRIVCRLGTERYRALTKD